MFSLSLSENMSQCTCGGQTETSRSLYSPSTMWALGNEFRSSGWAAKGFAHRTISLPLSGISSCPGLPSRCWPLVMETVDSKPPGQGDFCRRPWRHCLHHPANTAYCLANQLGACHPLCRLREGVSFVTDKRPCYQPEELTHPPAQPECVEWARTIYKDQCRVNSQDFRKPNPASKHGDLERSVVVKSVSGIRDRWESQPSWPMDS